MLGSAAFVHVLLRTAPGRVARGPRRLAIDLGGVAPATGLGGALPAIGTVLFSQGLTFLAWQISRPEIGAIVLGLLSAGAGTPLLRPAVPRARRGRREGDPGLAFPRPPLQGAGGKPARFRPGRPPACRHGGLRRLHRGARRQRARRGVSVDPRFLPTIEAIAGADPLEAWLAWNDFPDDDLVTAEQWVYAAGPALADGRTMRLWQTRDFGADRFPDDFDAWWAQWSRAHRLPPAPDEHVH